MACLLYGLPAVWLACCMACSISCVSRLQCTNNYIIIYIIIITFCILLCICHTFLVYSFVYYNMLHCVYFEPQLYLKKGQFENKLSIHSLLLHDTSIMN